MANVKIYVWGPSGGKCTVSFENVKWFDGFATPKLEGDPEVIAEVTETVRSGFGMRGHKVDPEHCIPADYASALSAGWEYGFLEFEGIPEDEEDPYAGIDDMPDAGISEAGDDDNWFEEDKYGIFEEGDYKDGEGEDGTIYDIVHDYLEPTRKKGG